MAPLKITWLKRILINDGKITKILNALCPAVKSIKDRIGEFANILMLRANNCFWVDVFKHYRNLCYRCVPVSFHDFYIRNWVESGIVSVGHLLGPNEYLSYEDFKAKYPDAIANVMLYDGIVRSVRHYQAKL